MKYVLLLLLLTACSKASVDSLDRCWTCETSAPSGVNIPAIVEICQEEKPARWTDGQGNFVTVRNCKK